jgi:gamma-glutamyltranspeptidase/glutathione hydrolase
MRHVAMTLAVLAWGVTAAAEAASPVATEGQGGMVATAQRLATEVGVEILRRGGNAVDAAVAVGYAEAVVNPCCGNIGGGGFMLLHLTDGRDVFVNFRETAPKAAGPAMYLDASGEPVKGASLYGWKAAAVPGTVLGLDTALKEYGTMKREAVMAPAIALARDGFVLTRPDTDILDYQADRFRQDPETAKIFLRPDGSRLVPGDRLMQPDLAKTLESIARNGPDAFYQGAIPQAVEAASAAHGGILTAADFAAFTVTEGAPLRCSYHGYEFLSAPPPSSGGVTLCEILDILDGYDLKGMGFHSAAATHVMVEAMRHAYFDRNTYLGDPAFVKNPLDRLLSREYAAAIRAEIAPDKAGVSKDLEPGAGPHEKLETTHYSVVDKNGNAASVTYTINGIFGAVVMAPGTGFLLNDEMDDFTVKQGRANMFQLVQGAANEIAPGKRPLSSMAPTIVTKDGKVFLVLGSPGGSRIITITLETALNVIDYGMTPQQAVDAPRFHHQWLPDSVGYEPFAFSPDTLKLLEGMGYKMSPQGEWGAAELIELGPGQGGSTVGSAGNDAARSGTVRPGWTYGASDDRRPAGAALAE